MEDDDADYDYAMQLWEQEESETGGWVEPAAQPAAKRGGGGRDCGAEAKSVLFSFPRRKSKAIEGEEEEEEEEEEGDVVQVSLPFEGEDNITVAGRVWRGSLLASCRIADCPVYPRGTPGDAAYLGGDSGGIGFIKALGDFRGVDTLELGCGRALVGLLAGELGAPRIVLTDCHDKGSLVGLKELRLPEKFEVKHLLWEQDMADREAEQQGVSHARPTVRHWSDAYRLEEFPALHGAENFDLVIASDCLYFTSQEAPLAACLQQRVRYPLGKALAVVQTRSNGGMQVVRLKESLEGMGFSVVHEDGPWDWEGMMQRHVRKIPGQEDVQLATTGNEAGEMSTHLLSIMWAPIPCKTGG